MKPKCPYCGKPLKFIETCESDNSESKTAWTCDCKEMVIYIVIFKQ
jgi:hypothetical protein